MYLLLSSLDMFLVFSLSSLQLVLSFIIEIPVHNANSVDPDQTPRSAYQYHLIGRQLQMG